MLQARLALYRISQTFYCERPVHAWSRHGWQRDFAGCLTAPALATHFATATKVMKAPVWLASCRLMRGRQPQVTSVRAASRISLPLIIAGALRGGFAASTRQSPNAANVQRFLNRPRVGILLPDEQTSHHHATLYVSLRSKRVTIPTNDLWIAALVVQHDLVPCSSDARFDQLAQIPPPCC